MKIGKILFTQTNYGSAHQTWYFPFKRLANKLILFDTHWNKILYGKKEMNKKFLEIIEKEKPDYIYMCFGPDEFELNVFLKIREISPKTKTIVAFGDDDVEFEKYSRYILLFIDYGLIHQKKYMKKYKKEGITNVFEIFGLDTNFFRPLKVDKKYDVTFFGLPLSRESGRYDTIKFLKDNGINVRIYGLGWEKYEDLKDIYSTGMESEKLIEFINQSKINLCLSKNLWGKVHMKNRVLEVGACKSFQLVEHCDEYLDFFKEGKEIIMFKEKEDLIKKINYYLTHEKKREEISTAIYKKIRKNHDVETRLKEIFSLISKRRTNHKVLPRIDKKIYFFSKKDLTRSSQDFKKILNDYDYISFTRKGHEALEYKSYLQSYALQKTQKPISCCDYYVYRKGLGDYLYFQTDQAYRNVDHENFTPFLNISQLMMVKRFFLDNLDKIKKAYYGEIDFLNEKNTAFVGFPLLRVRDIRVQKYEVMEKALTFKFFHDLYSKYHTRQIFKTTYLPTLLVEILSGKFFILNYLRAGIKDKNRKNKLKIYKETSKS